MEKFIIEIEVKPILADWLRETFPPDPVRHWTTEDRLAAWLPRVIAEERRRIRDDAEIERQKKGIGQ